MFIYKDFKENKLFIISYAVDNDRKLLYKNFALIRSFVEDIFGQEVEIEFEKACIKEDEKKVYKENLLDNHRAITSGEIQKNEDKNGFVANDSNNNIVDSTQDMQMEDILNSAMLNKTKELFDVKKITVKEKSK